MDLGTCAGSPVADVCTVLCLANYRWPLDQGVVCVVGGTWSIVAECVPVDAQFQVGTAGMLYMYMTEQLGVDLAWAAAFQKYFVEAAATLLGVNSALVRVDFSELMPSVRSRALQQTEFEVRVTQLSLVEENASVVESQMLCAFFECVGDSDSGVLGTAIASALEADGQDVPLGLYTAVARLAAFTFSEQFAFAAVEGSSVLTGSETDSFVPMGVVTGASVGGLCCVCVVAAAAILARQRFAKAYH